MSIHSSLKLSGTMNRHRSVLSRLERIKILVEQGLLKEDASPLGLPKVRHLKIRIRKEKAATATTTAAATIASPAGGAPAASSGTKAPVKTAAPAKTDAGGAAKKKE